MNKKIIIFASLFVLGLSAIAGFLFFTETGKNLISNPGKDIKKSTEVKQVIDVDKAAEKIMLDKEIQRRIDTINAVLRPNYLKVTNYQESNNLLGYVDPQVKWYVMTVDYDINPRSMADYDIAVNKGSLSELDFKKKSKLYKENLKRKMLNIYYPAFNYDRLKKIGFLGYITKQDGIYTMYPIGDYLDNTFNNTNFNIELQVKIKSLKDYFNYFDVFFNKDPESFRKLLYEVKKDPELRNNKKFQVFTDKLDRIFFGDIIKKRKK